MNKNNNDKTNNYFDSKFRDKSVLFIICIIIICLLPFILTRKPLLGIDFSETGDIGSTIGGIMGPFIAIIASYLTFIAFWVQFKANKKQTEQFDTQAKDVKLERFENKFYEMIKIQRDNVSEISINNGTVTNRKAFISMFLEVKCAFFVLKQLIDSGKIKHLTEEEAINISYITFFTGVGANSSKVAKYLLPNFNEKMLDIYFKELSKYQTEYLSFTLEQKKNLENLNSFPSYLRQRKNVKITYKKESITFKYYKPFNGHMSRLGHYYRHMYQTVKYVVEQNFVEDAEENYRLKYEYLKTLRAQLSDHELLLLYYNSLSTLGNSWISNNYFTDWKFLKNIPLPLADFGINPIEKLGIKNSKGDVIF